MTDDELRQLIRAAIQKHAGTGSASAPSSDFAHAPSGELRRDRLIPSSQPQVISISFGQYQLERATDDTSCLIEPAVQCNHCGFCKCHGH